jgi:hypothetical protein
MSHFLCSNNHKVYTRFRKVVLDSGFRLSFDIKVDDFYILSFKKLQSEESSFILYPNNDFVLVLGTLIYKEFTQSDYLHELFNDFEKSSIREVQMNSLGNYQVIIRKNGIFYFFCDYYNILPFYYQKTPDISLSNSLFHLFYASDIQISSPSAILEKAFFVEELGYKTIMQNVSRLLGSDFLEINKSSLIVLYNIPSEKKDFNFHTKPIDECVSEFARTYLDAVAKVKKNFSTFGLQQTGGLDNRIIFSGFMNHGIKPRTFYGKGNSVMTNTIKVDFDIVKLYAQKFGLNFSQMDWSHSIDDIEHWKELLFKYGFLFSFNGASKNYFDSFAIDDLPSFIETGYYGEVLRIRELALDKFKNKDFTIDEFLNFYFFENAYTDIFCDEFSCELVNLRSEFKSKFLEEMNRLSYQFDTVKIDNGKRYFDLNHWNRLEWVQFRYSHSLSVQQLNLYTNSISLLSTEFLHDYLLKLPYEYLQNAKFQLLLIKHIYPQSLTIPVFSHGSLFNYNKITNTLTKSISNEIGIFSLLKILFRHFLDLFNLAKLYYSLRRKDSIKTTDILMNYINSIIKKSKIFNNNLSFFRGKTIHLILLAHLLYALEESKKKSDSIVN